MTARQTSVDLVVVCSGIYVLNELGKQEGGVTGVNELCESLH